MRRMEAWRSRKFAMIDRRAQSDPTGAYVAASDRLVDNPTVRHYEASLKTCAQRALARSRPGKHSAMPASRPGVLGAVEMAARRLLRARNIGTHALAVSGGHREGGRRSRMMIHVARYRNMGVSGRSMT